MAILWPYMAIWQFMANSVTHLSSMTEAFVRQSGQIGVGVWGSGASSLWALQDFKLSRRSGHSKIIENHREIIENIRINMAIVGLFIGEMCLNNRFKSFLELICSRLV